MLPSRGRVSYNKKVTDNVPANYLEESRDL